MRRVPPPFSKWVSLKQCLFLVNDFLGPVQSAWGVRYTFTQQQNIWNSKWSCALRKVLQNQVHERTDLRLFFVKHMLFCEEIVWNMDSSVWFHVSKVGTFWLKYRAWRHSAIEFLGIWDALVVGKTFFSVNKSIFSKQMSSRKAIELFQICCKNVNMNDFMMGNARYSTCKHTHRGDHLVANLVSLNVLSIKICVYEKQWFINILCPLSPQVC